MSSADTQSPKADPTFYRSAAEAVAAPTEQLAYVVAFDRAGEQPDALAVVDVDEASDELRHGRRLGGPAHPRATSCTTSAGTPARAR